MKEIPFEVIVVGTYTLGMAFGGILGYIVSKIGRRTGMSRLIDADKLKEKLKSKLKSSELLVGLQKPLNLSTNSHRQAGFL